ncbi:hypothetical protein [Edaphobacter sp.]|uniref:hypothetical protein n=1 Tax=Edaphobacter sp. TaxID=1934404 RepID=UPI002D7FD4D5|nr:hypothetical protein [Edaphobacter sp.]
MKIEPHGGWYTFRARVDVEGQVKRVFRRFKISPIDPADPRWLNDSQCYHEACKMMAAIEGRNDEVVEGEEKGGSGDYVIEPFKPPVPTFAQQAKALMQEFKDPNDPKARSTQGNSASYLKVWLLPMLGDLPLDKINNTHLKDLVAWMKKGGPMPTRKE